MAENRISYLDRNYNDYKTAILDISQKYYSDIFASFNDASIGNWLIDVMSDISDNLSYNIDRTYQETDIDSATSRKSLLQIAKTNGLKIGGPVCAIVEVELSCHIPMNVSQDRGAGNNLSIGDENYCPYIKRGTLFSTGSQTFELVEDVDFKNQFDSNGISNRKIMPNRDGNGNIVSYTYTKLSIARAGYSKIYSKTISNNDITPFMNFTINDNNITNIESIITKDGNSIANNPTIAEFFVDKEEYKDLNGRKVNRFFEVNNLIDQYRFGYEIDENGEGYYNPVWESIDSFELTDENGGIVVDGAGEPVVEDVRFAMKGEWKRVKRKFITEFTNTGGIKITFGPGIENQYGNIPTDAREFTKYMMSRIEANDYMGILPNSGHTMFVLYHVGGGITSNIGANMLNTITSLNMDIDGNCDDPNDSKKKTSVRNTLRVTNPTPSYGGKDAPSDEEIKYLVKYNSASQNRCVTLKDYYSKISDMHPKYGVPFRHSVIESNNKVVVYALGLDYNGHLSTTLSETVGENIKEYLRMYKCVNDFVEIRSGRVINISFDVNVYIDKAYDKSEVVRRIIELIQNYMDIRKHIMGEDIFLGDLEKEISKLDGVVNLIALRCYNNIDEGYSSDKVNQTTIDLSDCAAEKRVDVYGGTGLENEIDLEASDKTLYSSIDSMFEIRYPSRDIRVRVKQR